MSLVRTIRRTFRRTVGRNIRGKSHRKSHRKTHRKTHRRPRVSTADLAASLFPTPRPALVPIPPVRSTHRSRRHRNSGYAAGPAGRRIFRVT